MADDLTEREQRLADLLGKMTEFQRRCVVHRREDLTLNQSYELACMDLGKVPGVSGPTTIHEIYNKPHVREYIDLLEAPIREEEARKAVMSREEMIARLTLMSRAVMDNVVMTDNPHEATIGVTVVKPTLNDARLAMKQLAELQGYEAPTRSEVLTNDRPARPVIPLGPAIDKLAELGGDTPEGIG